MKRNVASQIVSVFAFDYSTGAPKTGDAANLTLYINKDDAGVNALTDTSASEISSTNAPGWYNFDVSQSESNAYKLHFTGKSSTSNVTVVGRIIFTEADVARWNNAAIASPDTAGYPKVTVKVGTGIGEINLSAGKVPATIATGDMTDISAVRAAKIDNLDASITSLNNLSALANLYGSPLLEIPDSSSTAFAFTLVTRDNEGKLKDLDGNPTITAANAAGTDRSANLSAVSHPATGRYTFTYTVTSTDAEESLRITCSGTISAEARYVEWIGAVVDYDTLTVLNAIKTKTDNLPSDPADASDITSAFGTVNTTLGTIAGYLNANVGTAATRFLGMIELDGSVYRYTTNALEQGPAGGGGGGSVSISVESSAITVSDT